MIDTIAQAIRHGWPLIKLTAPTDKGTSPGKRPVGRGWDTVQGLTADEAEAWLATGGNIGVRCGNGLLVVDCDGDRPDGLPDTPTVQSGNGLHMYYHVPDGITLRVGCTARHIHQTTDTRGDGGQVVYPPSIHAETGALYEWVPGMSPDDLPIATLPQWVIDRINDPTPLVPRAATVSPVLLAAHSAAHIARGINDAYLASALRNAAAAVQQSPEGQRNNQLNQEAFSLAGLVELTDDDINAVLLPAAMNAGLGEHEARRTIQSGITAGRAKPRTIPDRQAPVATATATTPAAFTLGPDPAHVIGPYPRALADKYLETVHPGGTLRYWRGDWYEYNGRHYAALPEVMLKARLSETIAGWHYDADKMSGVSLSTKLKENLLRDVIGQLRQPGRTIIPDRREVPIWMDGTQRPPARDWVSLNNGLLHLGPGREFVPHTPALFCTSALPFDYDPAAPSPETWIEFLTGTWPGDDGADCALLLGEWFGYCVSRDMRMDRMMWMIGPTRSGKGVISRILTALLGPENVCNPTLGAFGDRSGMAVLIDKRLAIIGDARIGRRGDLPAIVERLLSLSGGDSQTIARKYKDDWTGDATVKIHMLSNELPNLTDGSGALLGRLLLIQTIHSHLGKENRFLEASIKRELPGILNWALDGLDRLTTQGGFTNPAASRDIIQQYKRISSPIRAFVEDCCLTGEGEMVQKDVLYAKYCQWADDEGFSRPYDKRQFGKQLKSAYPQITDGRPDVGTYGERPRYYNGIKIWAARELVADEY
jgi:putative DNA primase/helicase